MNKLIQKLELYLNEWPSDKYSDAFMADFLIKSSKEILDSNKLILKNKKIQLLRFKALTTAGYIYSKTGRTRDWIWACYHAGYVAMDLFTEHKEWIYGGRGIKYFNIVLQNPIITNLNYDKIRRTIKRAQEL